MLQPVRASVNLHGVAAEKCLIGFDVRGLLFVVPRIKVTIYPMQTMINNKPRVRYTLCRNFEYFLPYFFPYFLVIRHLRIFFEKRGQDEFE